MQDLITTYRAWNWMLKKFLPVLGIGFYRGRMRHVQVSDQKQVRWYNIGDDGDTVGLQMGTGWEDPWGKMIFQGDFVKDASVNRKAYGGWIGHVRYSREQGFHLYPAHPNPEQNLWSLCLDGRLRVLGNDMQHFVDDTGIGGAQLYSKALPKRSTKKKSAKH